MTIDQQSRRLWNKTAPTQRWAFFGCFVTGLLVHLYAFTNLIPNSDGLSRVFDEQQMTVSGRWFLHYASALNAFTQMPVVIGLLSLLFLGLAAALAVDLLQFRSKVLSGLVGAVMAAFPCLGYTFLYMFTASAYCLAISLAVLSVWLAKRCKIGWALGVIVLALAMGTYQAYAAVAVSLSLLVVLRETLDPKSDFRGTLFLGLRLVAYLIVGAVLYYVVLLVFLRVKNLELLSYLGMDEAASGYPIGQLPRIVFNVYKQAIAFFFIPGAINSFTNVVMAAADFLLLLRGVICFLSVLGGKKLWKDLWRPVGALAMLALLPLGIGFGQVISPYSDATPIMKYAYVCVYLAVLLLDDLGDRLSARKDSSSMAASGALVIACLLLSFLNTNNLLYTASAQAHRATESYLTRLMARVEDCPGYEAGMEVVIIGAIPEDQLRSHVESYGRVDHYSVPIHTPATLNKHIYYYLNDWLSIPVEEPSEETMIAVSGSAEFQNMPLYPAQGSVQVLDGRVVVRLREAYTPKSDYEIAYENRR